MKCTMLELELIDRSKIELTLNFARLLKVKNNNKKLYEEYMKALEGGKGFDPIFDSLKVLYVAYLCANSEKLGTDEVMSEDKFIEMVPPDMELINTVTAELIRPKKKVGFRQPFIKATGRVNKSRTRIPKFILEDWEDYYTYFVLILGMSEEIFFNVDYSSLLSILEDKIAYDNYINYVKEKEYEKQRQRRK